MTKTALFSEPQIFFRSEDQFLWFRWHKIRNVAIIPSGRTKSFPNNPINLIIFTVGPLTESGLEAPVILPAKKALCMNQGNEITAKPIKRHKIHFRK